MMALWIGSIVLEDFENHLQFHYGQGITEGMDKDSYWYPDWTRKYVDGDPEQGLKKILGIPIPASVFDGWHLSKVVRQFFYFNILMIFALLHMLTDPFHDLYWSDYFKGYVIILAGYAWIIYCTHLIFFETLFKKGF
jgi:hypothetical protein